MDCVSQLSYYTMPGALFDAETAARKRFRRAAPFMVKSFSGRRAPGKDVEHMALRGVIVENCDVYAPRRLGATDVTVLGEKIYSLERGAWKELRGARGIEWTHIGGKGLLCVPGLVDIHCHFAGAGGEGGPVYRTPPLRLSQLTRSGITTAVGLLGTDGYCRGLRDLLMKCRALDEEGISAWMWTGSYQVPGPTLTGDAASDIILIDKVIGLKAACSDHRASQTGTRPLRESAARSRVGGILAGKGGAVTVHIGEGNARLEPLLEIARNSDIPLTQFIPTHLNRSENVFRQAIAYGLAGGRVDVTSGVSEKYFFPGAVKPSAAAARLLEAGVPLGRVTMSSDGNGVMTRVDERGGKQPLTAPVGSLIEEFFDMIREGLGVDTAASVCAANPASAAGLAGKGRIFAGGDADFLLITRDLTLEKTVAKGSVLVDGDFAVKGLFEA